MNLREKKILSKMDIFSIFSLEHKSILKNQIVYLDVIFPILFSYEENENLFLAYVINYDEFDDELSIISTQVKDYEVLKEMVNEELSVFDIFDKEYQNAGVLFNSKKFKKEMQTITLGDKCDSIDSLSSYHGLDLLIEDLLPEDDFYLTPLLPNKKSLTQIKNTLKLISKKKEIETDNFIKKLLDDYFLELNRKDDIKHSSTKSIISDKLYNLYPKRKENSNRVNYKKFVRVNKALERNTKLVETNEIHYIYE